MSGSLHSRPCSLAYRLHGPANRLLNQLCHFGEGTLVLRQQGLSLATLTPFGLFVASGREGWHRVRDAISGLESDLRQPHHVHLFADPGGRRPVFAVGKPGGNVDLSVRFQEWGWESRPVREVIDAFDGIPVGAREAGIPGAGAWLDEWDQKAPGPGSVPWDVAAALDSCRCLEVEVRSGMHRASAAFRPTFLDSDGSVVRIADAERKHVVFADTGAAGFHWASLAPGHLRIAAGPESRAAGLALPAA